MLNMQNSAGNIGRGITSASSRGLSMGRRNAQNRRGRTGRPPLVAHLGNGINIDRSEKRKLQPMMDDCTQRIIKTRGSAWLELYQMQRNRDRAGQWCHRCSIAARSYSRFASQNRGWKSRANENDKCTKGEDQSPIAKSKR